MTTTGSGRGAEEKRVAPSYLLVFDLIKVGGTTQVDDTFQLVSGYEQLFGELCEMRVPASGTLTGFIRNVCHVVKVP